MRTGFYQTHDIGLRSSYPTIKNSAPQQPILWSSIALHCVKKMNGSHSLSGIFVEILNVQIQSQQFIKITSWPKLATSPIYERLSI